MIDPVDTTGAVSVDSHAERIAVVDVLRGLAVLGMAWVHVVNFSLPANAPPEMWTQWLATGQFYTLFTLLFGASFALQASHSERAREPRHRFVIRFVRRLVVLWAVFGIFCDAILRNNVLLLYSMYGLALPLVYRWKRGILLALIALCFVVPHFRAVAETAILSPEAREHRAAQLSEMRASTDTTRDARAAGDMRTVFTRSARRDVRLLADWRAWVIDLPVLGLILFGMLVVREGVLNALPRLRGRIVIFGCVAAVYWGLAYAPPLSIRTPIEGLGRALGGGAGLLFRGWLALAYASFVLALWGGSSVFHARARRVLATVAPLGRTALTWFILHQILLTVLFTPFGANLLLPQSWRFAVWTILSVAMIVSSTVWLRGMQQGPLEWLWRTLSELRHVPMLRAKIQHMAASGQQPPVLHS